MSRAGQAEIRPMDLPPEVRALCSPGAKGYRLGSCRIIVSLDGGGWHLSISREDKLPTWDEVSRARYELLPDEATMAMFLPPRSEYVNLHEYCFHLYEVKQ